MTAKHLWKIIDSNTRATAANYGGRLAHINQYPINYGKTDEQNEFYRELVKINHQVRSERFEREYEQSQVQSWQVPGE